MGDLRRFIRPLAFAAAGLLVLGGVGLFVANSSNKNEKYHLTAYFEKAIGLFQNSDVDILGVPVGKVTAVVPEGTRVRVEMELDSKYRVVKSSETFAQIVPISVISDRYIQLGPVYEDEGTFLADGDVLDTSVTQIPAELDDVFKQLKKLLDAIEPGKKGKPGALGNLIVQLNRTLKGREHDLRGTLMAGADLTGTLADARDDLDGILVNLDSLFGKLAKRAGSITELNRNFALVMTALAESRSDLEGTLTNLADLTKQVGDLARDKGDLLGRDLTLATKITSSILRNQSSVEESLTWLKVVGEGASNAYHGGQNHDVDVRDNAQARLECALLDQLPDGPIKDELKKQCREQTGEPPPQSESDTTTTTPLTEKDQLLDCDKGVRRVRRQLKRLEDAATIPQAQLDDVLDPLRKKLRKLKKECKKLGEAAKDPSSILDDLPDLPGLPEVGVPDTGGIGGGELRGAASGTDGVAVPTQSDSAWANFTDWLGDFFSFVGASR